jgi:hypothetical protein
MAWDSSAVLPRVHAEIESGRIWRAKEILQGQVASYPYSPELYASLGDVLAQMGDELEAGKYLFLGGRQDPRSQGSISLFLSRYTDPQVLFATFPSRAKLHRLEEYPTPVAAELRTRGVKPRVTHRHSKALPASSTPWAWLGTAWAGFFGVLLLLSLVIGLLWILSALGRVLFA